MIETLAELKEIVKYVVNKYAHSEDHCMCDTVSITSMYLIKGLAGKMDMCMPLIQ